MGSSEWQPWAWGALALFLAAWGGYCSAVQGMGPAKTEEDIRTEIEERFLHNGLLAYLNEPGEKEWYEGWQAIGRDEKILSLQYLPTYDLGEQDAFIDGYSAGFDVGFNKGWWADFLDEFDFISRCVRDGFKEERDTGRTYWTPVTCWRASFER